MAAAAAALALIACTPAGYRGGARALDPQELGLDVGGPWTTVGSLPPRPQRADDGCGAAVATSVLAYWGVRSTVAAAERALRKDGVDGIGAGSLRDYLRDHGVRAYLVSASIEDLVYEVERGRPVIIGTMKRYGKRQLVHHYEIVVATRDRGEQIAVYDPATGWRRYSRQDLLAEWQPTGLLALVVLPRTIR
jgi:ABC-type bacteriocin/lantibiotic exporter with double-glycine peptidase domain